MKYIANCFAVIFLLMFGMLMTSCQTFEPESTKPQVTEHVTLSGGVKKPGSYSLQKYRTLNDLVFKAGGGFDMETIEGRIIRVTRKCSRSMTQIWVFRTFSSKEFKSFQCEPNDKVYVERIRLW